ncbi:GDSL-type esterase/lipase family protein [Maribacter polysiphoniae]|nr:GDSL-type esterase/lipase family protein [Maribacter polysiphoniae]
MNKLLLSIIGVFILFGCRDNEKHFTSENNRIPEIMKNPASLAVKKEGVWWINQHQTILNRLNPNSEMILVGNSIFHTLDNEDREGVWQKHLDTYNTINMGISGDRTENVIWRLENGSLENINPKVAVVLIGTNNTDGNHYLTISTPEELAGGIRKICTIIHKKLPNTKILLMGILPYGNKPNHRDNINKATNNIISKFPEENPFIHYIDIGPVYYNEEGMVNRELMPDYLHPNAEGHMLMFKTLEGQIEKLMVN